MKKQKIKQTKVVINSKIKNWLLRHTITVFSCVLIIALGITALTYADPVTTTIGENISTNDLTVAGNVTSGTWQGSEIQDAYIADDITASNYLPLTGGDLTGDLSTTGSITGGTWQGTPIATQYGGTGQDWSAVTQGNIPYFSDTGTLSSLAPGTAGQFLKSQGAGADPAWDNVARTATFVVCANDSLDKTQCDYVCDGTDDQIEIQATIDALPSGGGKVVLMEGTYNISSSIDISSTTKLIHLSGMGQSTIINNMNDTGGHGISAINTPELPGIRYGVLISNLTVRGINGGGDGIHIAYADCPTVRNVYAICNGRHGIYITHNANVGYEGDALISDNYVLDNVSDGIYVDEDVHEAFILNNHIENNGRYGVFSYWNNWNVNIISNNIEDNANTAIYINEGTGVLISSNVLEGTGEAVIVIAQSQMGRITIIGNQLESAKRGIRFINTATIKNISITGNTFHTLSLSSATIKYTEGLAIIGNTSQYINDSSVGGYYIDTSSRVVVSGNSVQSKAAAVSSSDVHHMIISNNVFESQYVDDGLSNHSNIRLSDSTNILVTDNIMKRYGDTPLSENIDIRGIGFADSKISNNIFAGATTALSIETDCPIIASNIGYTTENSGTATLVNGTTSIAVDHGLDVTPAAGDIVVTPIETWGNMTKFWIGNYTSTQFTIYADQNPGQDVDFAWKAVVL